MADFLHILRQANRNLDAVLTLWKASAPGIPITADDLACVLTELLRVAEELQNRHIPETQPELTDEICKYRSHLEKLRTLMPLLQTKLLVERARLEAERSHLEAGSAWADLCRSTR